MSIRNVSDGFATRPCRQNAYLPPVATMPPTPARPAMSDAHGTYWVRAVSSIADTTTSLSQRVTYRVNVTRQPALPHQGACPVAHRKGRTARLKQSR